MEDIPPTISSLKDRIADLQHQSTTLLFLSALNLVMNILTIGIGFLISMS